ncbi:MAG: amidohydrolase family protein [Proteobacteria bacterium]|nr:amidohydrolase family protein [Pseudomonadota bacterium]
MSNPAITGEGRRPRLAAPPGACECHSHVYGPFSRFPLAPGRKPHAEAPVAAYERLLARLGFARGVIVQPSAYAADNACTLAAIAEMGTDRARGVAVTRPEVSRAELGRLHAGGIRGMRFYLFAPDLGLEVIDEMARRIAPLGWHVDVQGDGRKLPDWIPTLARLPVDVVIDHIGRIPPESGTENPAFAALLGFVETGRCWVKLSAPYYGSRQGPPAYADIAPRVKALIAARPDRLVWAANWPHPSFAVGEKPDDADLLDLLLDWAPKEETRRMILADNPARLYGFA